MHGIQRLSNNRASARRNARPSAELSGQDGINAAGHGWDADLKQTQLFPIRMQTIRFGIDCNAIGSFDLLDQTRELRDVRNHVSR